MWKLLPEQVPAKDIPKGYCTSEIGSASSTDIVGQILLDRVDESE